jgi:hypothetical protein
MKKLIFIGLGLFTIFFTGSVALLVWGFVQFMPSKETIGNLTNTAKVEASALVAEGQKLAENKSLNFEEPCRRALGTAAGRVMTADVMRAWDSVEAIYAHCVQGGGAPLKSSDRPT